MTRRQLIAASIRFDGAHSAEHHAAMFVLAHLSDPHMASRPRFAELAGKRGLGFINWQRKRKNSIAPKCSMRSPAI